MLRKSLLKNAFDVISIVKVNTIKWQIYPDEVFYTKDLLPMRVTISLATFAYNNFHSPNLGNYSPFKLTFWREPRELLDLVTELLIICISGPQNMKIH